MTRPSMETVESGNSVLKAQNSNDSFTTSILTSMSAYATLFFFLLTFQARISIMVNT